MHNMKAQVKGKKANLIVTFTYLFVNVGYRIGCELKQGILKREVSLYLLFDWFGLLYFTNKNQNC
jgi:hypothetical protein